MKKVIKKHPIAIRWFHWVNFPVIAIMIWSGLLIYWANGVYRLGWSDKTVLKFFPDSFYKALHIPFRLAEGMSIHFVFMWLFAINGFIYVLYLIISGEWRLIVPNRKSLKESLLVVMHDLHVRKSLPPQKKYNAAQRIAYTMVIIMGLGSVLTGLSIYKPIQFQSLCSLLGGYEWARAEHFILTLLFTLFFVVHIIQVILAGWNNFRSMVTGLDVLKAADEMIVTPLFINNEPGANRVAIAEAKNFEPGTRNAESDKNDVILEEEKIPSEDPGIDVEPGAKNSPSADENTSTEPGETNK
ncbi:MAG: cytochrome b/b6 domain-containing protein [Ginsengibacter sp.]